MTAHLRGVYPVLSTPFTADGDVDDEVLAQEIRWLIAHGVDGVTVAMVSEVLRLSPGERRHLTETTRAVLPPDVGLVVSVGAESTRIASELARHATDAGATALMAIPPISVGVDEGELFDYYAALFGATPLPVVVQDASGYIGRPMSVEFYVRLMQVFGDERVCFKPEADPLGPRLSSLRDATGGRARVFEGSGGGALVDSHRRGAVGTMPGPEVPWAIAPVGIARARRSGDRVSHQRRTRALAGAADESRLLRRRGEVPVATPRRLHER